MKIVLEKKDLLKKTIGFIGLFVCIGLTQFAGCFHDDGNGDDGNNGSAETANYTGTWLGTTGQGYDLNFKVEEGGSYDITKIGYLVHIDGAVCEKDIEGTISDLSDPINKKECITGYTAEDFSIEFHIFFDSETKCHGTWKATDLDCDAINTGTFTGNKMKNKEYYIAVDDCNIPDTLLPTEECTPLPTEGWNYIGGTWGLMNIDNVDYCVDVDSAYTATVNSDQPSETWGGIWYSLSRPNSDNIPLDFKAIFGPYVKDFYQGEIIELEIVVRGVNSPSNNANLELKFELKDINDNIICSSTPLTNLISKHYPNTYVWTLPENCKQELELVTWVIDKAKANDSISIDKIRLKAKVPVLPTDEQAFLWTYSWLMANYDPNTGLVQDNSIWAIGEQENISATSKAAKISYYAYKKGYANYENTKDIITNIADTLINVVDTGPPGVNNLWPHYTKNGGSEVLQDPNNIEWASGDTAFAALDIITALEMLGDPRNQMSYFENLLQDFDWQALILEDGGISHGYDYESGTRSLDSWKGFGMETIGVNWAYASATGDVAMMGEPPSDNGSGFIDNAQYPMVFSGLDRWGNNWDEYRNSMANTQIEWYCTTSHRNANLCNANLFGLSAAEMPEGGGHYVDYGMKGRFGGPKDGNGEVIVLHYSGMIADIRPQEAKRMWEVLLNRDAKFLQEQDRVIISPLNNMESMRVHMHARQLTVNHLRSSWNLALQAEGWAFIDSNIKNDLNTAIQDNTFLNRGYNVLKGYQ